MQINVQYNVYYSVTVNIFDKNKLTKHDSPLLPKKIKIKSIMSNALVSR